LIRHRPRALAILSTSKDRDEPVGPVGRALHPELAPINPTDGAIEEAQAELDRHPDEADRVAALLALVDGFETPYSLELVATVHFAAGQEPETADPAQLADRVAEWSLRKARLFTEDHVHLAARRLAEHGLLPS